MKWIPLLLLVASTAMLPAAESANNSAKNTRPARGIQDDPNLPRVLLIGDSISLGYTAGVRNELKGKANLHRIRDNAGSTTNGLAHLQSWLGPQKWDVIYFNFGLHDLRLVGETGHVASLEEYEKNLEQIVAELKKTGAKLIWATTTPVPSGNVKPPRRSEDVPAYNAVANKVMTRHGIPISDLYGFALPKLKKLQLPANVHFGIEGSEELAKQVAASIVAVMPKK